MDGTSSGGEFTPAQIQAILAAQDKANAAFDELLGGPVPAAPLTPGFIGDKKVAATLLDAATRQGHGAEASLIAGHQRAHHLLMLRTHAKMTRDPVGQKLLAEYKTNGGPTSGWLINLLNWFITNGPALMNLIMMILKMFGLGMMDMAHPGLAIDFDQPYPWPDLTMAA